MNMASQDSQTVVQTAQASMAESDFNMMSNPPQPAQAPAITSQPDPNAESASKRAQDGDMGLKGLFHQDNEDDDIDFDI